MKFKKIYHVIKPVPRSISALMIIMNTTFTQDLSLIPKVCYSCPLSWSDVRIMSTSSLKHLLAINSFASIWHAIFPGPIITLRAWASKRKQGSSASHVLSSLRASADPWASERSFWPQPMNNQTWSRTVHLHHRTHTEKLTSTKTKTFVKKIGRFKHACSPPAPILHISKAT